jgi:hypothetical protein
MTIVRRQHNSRFASLPNAIWEDPCVSVEAKGVLGYLLSRPHNWNVRPHQVGQVLNIGKDKLQRIFQELISAGYVTREQNRDEAGSFGNMEYVVRDETVASLPQPENPQTAKPHAADPQTANPAAYKELSLLKTDDRIGEARARGQSAFTEGSKALANAFWKALGFNNPLEIPPEFAGVDWRAIEWERAGWTVDLIDAEARRIARDKPLKPLSYFEKVFATSFAKRQAPLPIVEVREAEKLTVTSHGTSKTKSGGSLIAAIDRQLAKIQREENADFAVSEDVVHLLPNRSVS